MGRIYIEEDGENKEGFKGALHALDLAMKIANARDLLTPGRDQVLGLAEALRHVFSLDHAVHSIEVYARIYMGRVIHCQTYLGERALKGQRERSRV